MIITKKFLSLILFLGTAAYLASFETHAGFTAGFEVKIPKDDYHFFYYGHCDKCHTAHNIECVIYEGVDSGYYYFDFKLFSDYQDFTFALSKPCNNCKGYCNFCNKNTITIEKDMMHFMDMHHSSGIPPSGTSSIMSLPSGGDVYASSYQNNSQTNQTIRVINFWNEDFLGNTNSNGGLALSGVVTGLSSNAVLNVELPPNSVYIYPDIEESGSIEFDVSVPDISQNDNDGDGLTFDEEYALGTCDSKRDTDKDGLEDKTEIVGASISMNVYGQPQKTMLAKTKPAYYDTDRDGRSDHAEITGAGGFVTDPNDPDCDGDGVPDGFDTDPLRAFSLGGDNMPSGWVSFWRIWGEKAEISAAVLNNLQNPNADCNGNGFTNAQELQRGKQPIFPSAFFKLSFGDISRVYTNDILNLNFNLSIFASHSVTGAVLISKSNWSDGLLRGCDNYDLYDLLPSFPEYHTAPFVASLGLSNKFNFSMSRHFLNYLNVTNENIRVYILGRGLLPDYKPIYISEVLPDVEGAVTPPILLSPADNAEYLETDNTVTFQWGASSLTSLWSLSVFNGNDFEVIDQIITTANNITTNLSYPSKYYWNVSAVSANGKLVRSEERHVVVRWPDADTDSDGFNDGYEFEHGSDWNDANSAPVIMQGTNYFSSAANLLVSVPLKALSGVPPYKWKIVGGNLPVGLKLLDNAIQGSPRFEGKYSFRLNLSDRAGSFQLIDCVYEVTPEREKALQKAGQAKFVPNTD